MTEDWRTISLSGAGRIARDSNVFEIVEGRLPGAKFKVKVLEEAGSHFSAFPNVCVRTSDGPNWVCGLGSTEAAALEEAIRYLMLQLDASPGFTEDVLEWSDSHDF